MIKNLIAAFMLFILSNSMLISQPAGSRGNFDPEKMKDMKIGTISGVVHEANSDKPVIYANVTLKRMKDSSIVSGDITDDEGRFEMTELPPGFYILDVKFLGFKTKRVNNIKLLPKKPIVDLGTVYLDPNEYQSEGVEVTAEKERVEYKLDRKIVNITNDVLNAGGSAVEALERTPSVNVDLEGNVSLRGSSDFTVLINGKPSVLEGSDALQQIPVASIDKIEILTNPSAKYDPEGIAGIINVVLKESVLKGISGMTSVSAGVNDKYNYDGTVNFGFKKLNLSGGVNWQRNRFLSNSTMIRATNINDTTFDQLSYTDGFRDRNGYNLRFGADYSFTRNFSSKIDFGYGHSERGRTRDGELATDYSYLNDTQYSINDAVSDRTSDFYSMTWTTNWNIDEIGQKLETSVFYSASEGDDIDFQEQIGSDLNWNSIDYYLFGSEGIEIANDSEIRVNLDYKYPFNDVTRFEVGYQGDFEADNEDFTQSFLDTVSGEFYKDNFFSNSMNYSRDIHSGYGLFVSNVVGIEYQLGLRTEYTDRLLEVPDQNREYILDRLDFFPSLNFSRKFEGNNQIMGGYSRRIRRPRGYWLEPFPNYRDAFSYRIGDPEIEPEYTDSYELGYMKYFNKALLSVEGYYRYTTNQFSRFAELDENGLFRYSPRNVGNSSSSGVELSFNDKLTKWFSYNIIGNVFYQTLSGDIIEEGVDTENVTWNMRAFTDFTILPNLKLQLSGFLRGPEITVQGERDPFYFFDAGLRLDLMNRKLNMIFNVRNLFDTMAFQGSSSGPGFYNYYDFEREAYIAQLTINYRFNDYKQQKGNRGNGGGGMDIDMDF